MTSKQKVELMREGQHVRVTHKFIKDCLELLSSAEYASMQILVGYAYLEVIEKPETSSEELNIEGEGSMKNRLNKMENEINEIIAKFDVEMIEVEAEENKPETFAIVANGQIIADGITSRSYTERIVTELKKVRKKVVEENMDLSEAFDYTNMYYSGIVQRERLINNFIIRIGHYNEFGDTYKKVEEEKEIIKRATERYGSRLDEFKIKIEKVETDSEIIENSAVYYEDIGICIEELKDGCLYLTKIDGSEAIGTYKIKFL